MRAILVCLFIATCLFGVNCKPNDLENSETRIVGGQAADPGEWGWQVSIQYYYSNSWRHICGGTLIKQNVVLTAAQCVSGLSIPSLRVAAGMNKMSDGGMTSAVNKVTVHPQFGGSSPGFPNDLALLELQTPFLVGGAIQIATLPSSRTEDFANLPDCWMTGWGRTSSSSSNSDTLMEAQVTNIRNTQCVNQWNNVNGASILDSHICAYEIGKSSCSGDIGGPYVCMKDGVYKLAGVMSWGIQTCSGDYPSVSVRVSNYIDWIAISI
ncbi:fibrinolytic enzyme, isozyme C-like [Crassostrea virginica]|uniref:Fibrinolytic enzyme, isozyme C-like n=1 Tax=Crassostrea virginica TaxID=6565 RepID=A0A8B8DIP6_CRAVI|nr:fibrinolytic enzyme, isozyme C-like [Crassostrea virginica]